MTAAKCLDCHTALRSRIAARQGLHARPGHQRCETCHNEHHGREFQLVFWGKAGPAAFDHRQTGFPLEGAHAAQGCRECHRPAFVQNKPALQAGKANPAKTFLGLSRGCLSCHRDEHRGQFAPQSCLSCHTLAGWKPPQRFDHAKTSFPLTGRHGAVACASCHPSRSDALATDPDRTFLALKGLKHEGCSSCHRDPHQGRFGATCQSCHSTAGWKEGARAHFDHGRTGFPLTGRHAAVACASCHKARSPSGAVTFTKMAHGKCTDCHRDPHQGRLGTTCQQCHSTGGWRVVGTRSNFDHDRTRFPLRGEHREVACQQCHAPGRPLRLGTPACASCHRDVHQGQLAGRSGTTACESCHTVEGFSPSSFTVADHQKSSFPLQGAHLAVPCNACHTSAHRFRFASAACQDCHGDPHEGQFAQASTPLQCQSCHSVVGWRRIAFDHDRRSRFKLEGAHRSLPCGACHKTETRNGKPFVRFKPLPVTCEGCHGSPTKPARRGE